MNPIMFPHDNIITANQLEREDIIAVLDRAEELDGESLQHHDETILALLFFEPSTRTKMSFDTAIKRLGGNSIDLGAVESSSISKGESLADTVRVIEGYADAIVLRHPQEGSAKMAAEYTEKPIINGGDGAGHHPTQTLLDLYTIRQQQSLDDLTIGIMGDLKYGRTVHSLARALTNFDASQHFISPESLALPDSVRADLHDAGVPINEHRRVGGVLDELDVLYVTRIQRERFPDEEEYQKVAGQYTIDHSMLESAAGETVVMHPLPRVDEIDTDVDGTDHAQYFEQAHNGVPVRMAILDLLTEQ